jgi:hypothetical protein
MSPTPNLALAYLAIGQAQKEITHNDALNDLDALTQLSVLDRTLNTPPASPSTGDTYIIGSSPTGAWSGAAGKIAAYFAGWKIKTPLAGWCAWVRPENRLLAYSGTSWSNLATLFLEASASWTPGTVANGGGTSLTGITLSGAAFGDFVLVAAPYDLQGLTATAYVSAANTLVIRLQNGTGGGVTLGAGSWKLRLLKQ